MNINVNQNVVKGSSAMYVLGFIGAGVYYFQHAFGAWAYVIGFVKALLWPAFLVYQLFGFLRM